MHLHSFLPRLAFATTALAMCFECSARPANESCSTATPILPGITLIADTGWGASYDAHASCPWLNYDLWYVYTHIDCNAPVTVSTCGSATDTAIAVYSGTCGTLNPLQCRPIGCFAPNSNAAEASFSAEQGRTYYINIGLENFTVADPQTRLTLTYPPQLSNDVCSSASTILADQIVNFNTTCAITDGPPVCAFTPPADQQIYRDVWYRWVPAQSGTAEISLCGSSFDTRLAIYPGTCTGTSHYCNDTALLGSPCAGGTNAWTYYSVVGGIAYNIRVGGTAGAFGQGTLAVKLIVPPTNDLCANAQTVTIPFSSSFNISTATFSSGAAGCNMLTDLWYRFVAPCNGPVTVTTCESGFDTAIAAYSLTCTTLNQLGCNDDAPCPVGGDTLTMSSRLTFETTAGQSYYVRVGRARAGGSPVGIISIAPGAENDLAANAPWYYPGALPFDTRCAGTDGPTVTGCSIASSILGHDVWVRYPAFATGWHRFETCGATFDTGLAIYSGIHTPVTADRMVACADDGCPGGATTTRLDAFLTGGQYYLVRIGGEGTTAEGTGALTISYIPPPNDNCSSQNPDGEVLDGVPYAFNTYGATDSNADGCTMRRDVWLRLPDNCNGPRTLTTCGSGFDTAVTVYEACDRAGDSEPPVDGTCVDDSPCQSGGPQTMFSTIQWVKSGSRDSTRVRIGSPNGSTGAGTLLFKLGASNDECGSAATVAVGQTAFDTRCADTDGPSAPATCTFQTIARYDVWFRFVAPCAAPLTIDTCGSSFNTGLIVYSGDSCPADNGRLIACNDNFCNNHSSVTFDAAAAATYLIRVFGIGNPGAASGLGVLNVAIACCTADFNESGGLSVQDIFDFLGAYFAGDPAADFNGLNGHTVQDIFDYLAAYFAGCA